MADDVYLPPVVIDIALNDAGAITQLGALKGTIAGVTSDISASTGAMTKDLEGIGTGAAAGSSKAASEIAGVGGAVNAAEKDVEAKSSAFSMRLGSLFESLGNSMGSFGVPFGNSVKKMGYSIKEGEDASAGFGRSLKGLSQIAMGAGLLLAAGIGIASIKAADAFDVAQTRLRQAVQDTGNSFKQFEPSLNKTEGSLTNLGFTTTESAQALGTLTVSTHSPAKAMGEMGLAADLARYKNISLAQASETLAKVNAGSLRPLMQLGIQLDIGSLKLTAAVKGTEAVSKAKKELKAAEENLSAAVAKAAQEHQAAIEKVKQAEDTLHQAQETLKGGSESLVGAQEALKTAQRGVTEAAEKEKKAIKEAAAALKAAEEAARETAEQGAKGIEGAKKNLSNLEQERAKEGNEATIKQIENEEKAAEAAGASGAAILASLKARKAQLEAADNAMTAGKKQMQLQEAEKGVTEAEANASKNNVKALAAVKAAHEKLAATHKAAMANSKENIEAAARVTSAQRGVAAAERTVANDQIAVKKASEGVAAAQHKVGEASAAVTKAQEKLKAAHEKVAEAERKLRKDHMATGEVLEALKKKVGGTAKAFGHTLAGQLDIAKAKLNQIGVEIGAKLTPILIKLIEVIKTIAHALKPLWDGFVEGVQWVGRAAANLDIAWERNWGGIRKATESVVHVIIAIFKGVVNVIKWVVNTFISVVTFFHNINSKIIGGLWSLLVGLVNFGKNVVKAIIKGILSAPGAIIDAIKSLIPGSGIISGAAHLLGLAEGGIVTKPTLAVVGEAGPEMVVPLKNLKTQSNDVRPLPPANQQQMSVQGGGRASGLHVDQLVLNGPQMSPNELMQEMYLKLRPLVQQAST